LGVSFLPTPLRLFLPCFADLLLACFADLSYFSIPLLLFHFTLLARFLPRVARFVGNTGINRSIDHNILLSKLHSFGFSASLLTFFKSYLTERKQYVFYKGFKSKEIIPTSGVPQGSVLGPLFFSIFINDIVNGLSSLKLLFADDFKLYREISTISDCVLLQDDYARLHRFVAKHYLP
jgi:hypothetical protein